MQNIAVIIILSISLPVNASSKISESQLKKYTTQIMDFILRDNPDDEEVIRKFCNGYLKKGKKSIRLNTRLAQFFHQMNVKGIKPKKVRFFQKDDNFILIILMNDLEERKNYLLILDYTYSDKGVCVLNDIQCANTQEEITKGMRTFFQDR